MSASDPNVRLVTSGRTCRFCHVDIPDDARTCPSCGKQLLPPAPPPPPQSVPAIFTPQIGLGFWLRKMAWLLALLAMLFFAVDGVVSYSMATSAPQQAAAAGSACFHMIVPYVIARDELLRGPERG